MKPTLTPELIRKLAFIVNVEDAAGFVVDDDSKPPGLTLVDFSTVGRGNESIRKNWMLTQMRRLATRCVAERRNGISKSRLVPGYHYFLTMIGTNSGRIVVAICMAVYCDGNEDAKQRMKLLLQAPQEYL